MLQTFRLFLPVLIPSWKFFDCVAPSPRVEYRLDNAKTWQPFRPRKKKRNIAQLLTSLLWNPSWNESLFLVSCAERLMQHPTEHSRQEIYSRINMELRRQGITGKHNLQFRLAFHYREGGTIKKEVVYLSEPESYEGVSA